MLDVYLIQISRILFARIDPNRMSRGVLLDDGSGWDSWDFLFPIIYPVRMLS